ncbi:hypothetical protein DH2020_001111 [Rehmannia glutinosa]|uniref:Uncharacterized protein n=1 Tax=Rehmannia glutinosa TaxID=99300 RepID=A0ABR0XYE7_REHGL
MYCPTHLLPFCLGWIHASKKLPQIIPGPLCPSVSVTYMFLSNEFTTQSTFLLGFIEFEVFLISLLNLAIDQYGSDESGYSMWPPQPQFQKPNPNPGAMKPPSSSFKKSLGPRSNWKGKKVNKPNDKRRNEQQKSLMAGSSAGGIAGGVNVIGGGGGLGNLNFNNYQPPTLNELQHQNRLKTRKFFPKKKFNKNNSMNMNMNMSANNNNFNNRRSAPFAPRNTSSFIIRAKKSGGIASLVSPSPMTPAVLPTPIFSPSREVLVDMAKEEWGVDGYGSMKGLIRLRSPGHEMEMHEDEEEDEGGSSESDVEEHVEVERRLDHDLSRFEMIYNPNSVNVGGMDYHNVLENRVDDQDSHIAQLEEENLILKERLFLMERELGDLRRRMQFLERRENRGEDINEEVVENDSENEGESRGEEAHSMDDNNEDFSEENNVSGDGSSKGKGDDGHNSEGFEAAAATEKNEVLGFEKKEENNDDRIAEADKNGNVTDVEDKEKNNNDEFMDANKAEENNVVVKDREDNNNDDRIAEADKNGNVTDVEDKEKNNIDANKAEENNLVVKDRDEGNNEDNKCLDMEVKAVDNIDVESSKPVVAGGDICMEELGAAKDTMIQPGMLQIDEVDESSKTRIGWMKKLRPKTSGDVLQISHLSGDTSLIQ